MTTLVLRDGAVADADRIAEVHVRSWQAAYRGLIDQELLDGLSISDRADGWRRNISAPLPTIIGILVAERKGRIVGWTSFGSGREEEGASDGEIYGIYADPAEWSTGVGRALLAAAEHRITAAGHTQAYLWVLDGNERADAFYARHGWQLDGARKVEERPDMSLREHRRVKRFTHS
ncbi:GNAT family N-acetyltransferase [Microbacterium sp. APC 3901]|uniref:GNAT family N-acetyltransferase n=1 Tax=Microbacterium sp. APC 3901 TaxID=3035192 RepID=UPI0025B3B007|nr:GNAT family N-acetyltransferase [Microbacterium sp. APC 3901]MDN3445522.1 GNAT family N-acetyltransferase [Microbacterium sp. APC 3901]